MYRTHRPRPRRNLQPAPRRTAARSVCTTRRGMLRPSDKGQKSAIPSRFARGTNGQQSANSYPVSLCPAGTLRGARGTDGQRSASSPLHPPAPSYAPPFRQRTEVSNWRSRLALPCGYAPRRSRDGRSAVSKETQTQRLGPLPMQRTGHLTKAKDSKSSGQQSHLASLAGRTVSYPVSLRSRDGRLASR